MIYTILHLKGGREVGSTPWDRGLPAAKLHAVHHGVMTKADLVQIKDETGAVIFTVKPTGKRE